MTEKQGDSAFDLIGRYRLQIMGFAALWLFLYHTQDSCLLFPRTPVIGDVESLIACNGYAGADIFFFLSGMFSGIIICPRISSSKENAQWQEV